MKGEFKIRVYGGRSKSCLMVGINRRKHCLLDEHGSQSQEAFAVLATRCPDIWLRSLHTLLYNRKMEVQQSYIFFI